MGKDQPQRPAALHARRRQRKQQNVILFCSSTSPSQLNGITIEKEKSPRLGQLAAQANHGPNAEDDDDGGNIAMVTTKLRHLYQPTTVQTSLKMSYNLLQMLMF